VSTAQVTQLVDQLDEGLFLDSPRFHAHRATLLEAFRAAPHRAPSHAGGSYPDDGPTLARILDGLLARSQGEPPPATRNGDAPVGLIAPHIDFPRGGPVYAGAYRALAAADRPDLVVVLGTDHNGTDHPFTLTRKSYATPLGVVETDAHAVDAIVRYTADTPGLDLFADEFHHRHEHSIEFQAVWLRHVYGERVPPVLPVLCGSLHQYVGSGETPSSDSRVVDFLAALRRVTEGRRTLVVAGADLAHVGPRFGDGPMTAADRERVERADRASLAACARGDADGFFAFVSAERDERRICGLSPIFTALALLDDRAAPGELFGYAQCDADDRGESFVSIAAMLL
jgi:AmmeMemoRadiSam system protein B